MVLRIESDYQRFRRIVKGKIREELKKFMSNGELFARKGKNIVSVPLPQIDIPTFRYGPKQSGGVGQGEGEVGQQISPSDVEGEAKAGNLPGKHVLEVDITIEELAHILGEELELPRIEPKGKKNIIGKKDKYSGIYKAGPESLRHFKRTYKEALKRHIMSGIYDPSDPHIVPIKEDKRYRSWKTNLVPECNAVIIYIMDVSGSMGDEQKEIVRIESFWIHTWLKSQYKGVESRYIIHDATAREVDEETFFHTRESGGTVISSSYNLCKDMIASDYGSNEWNIYPFQFSDGDNWSTDDTLHCVELLKKELLPRVNMFCYGQVESQYGSGQFLRDLQEQMPEEEKLVTSQIRSKEEIYDSIKTFLGKGK